MQIPSDSCSQRPHSSIKKKPSSSTGNASASEKRHTEIEEIDAAIGKMSRTINAASYELMLLIREFDERAGWLKWGYDSALPWLKWRCDLSTNAARDKLRMAHALKELPQLSQAFSTGELSYTKVRALTRIATLANEGELIGMAMRMSARHVEEHCKQRHNASKASTATAVKAQQNRNFRVWHDQARGTVNFSIELPAEDGELMEQAVEKAAVKLSAETGSAASSSEETISWATQQADALVLVCRSFLDDVKLRGDKRAAKQGENQREKNSASFSEATPEQPACQSHNAPDVRDTPDTPDTTSSTADHYQVVVHVDEAALAGNETGASQLPIESVRRLCCDGSVVPMVDNEKGEPLNVGRKVRIVTTAIRRALWARDKGCGFPGCSHTRFVDAHHIKHWADGGETSVENMVLLCSSHHKLVHEGGYIVQRDHSGELFFRRPDGKAVPHCGYRLDDQVDADSTIDGDQVDPLVAEYVRNSQEFLGVQEFTDRYIIEESVAA